MNKVKRKVKVAKLWYHTRMMRLYGWLTESIDEDPEEGMTEQGEIVYLKYFTKFMHHESKVRELKGA